MQLEVKQEMTDVPAETRGFMVELRELGDSIPHKGLFAVLLLAWILLFHFLGNSVLGYFHTSSLFAWLSSVYQSAPDDNLGMFVPLAVAALLWWKREELISVSKRVWWPALAIFVFALFLHVLGYAVQQTRFSLIAFFVGWCGLMGMLWGWRWLSVISFPFFLFVFMMPLGSFAERPSLELRKAATTITVGVSKAVFGIPVVQSGTSIYDPSYRYQYEVAAACSGIRSLSTMLLLACVVAFVIFQKPWKRALLIGAAIPFAVLGNTFRLLTIIIAADQFGQTAGDSVHNSWLFGLAPYVPAMLGMFLIARWLREDGSDLMAKRPA
jgi:exosortase